jgi:hypothetical protein
MGHKSQRRQEKDRQIPRAQPLRRGPDDQHFDGLDVTACGKPTTRLFLGVRKTDRMKTRIFCSEN